MKSIKNFENEKVAVSNRVLGGRRDPTGSGSTKDVNVYRDGKFHHSVTKKGDFNPFNNDRV